MMKNINNVINSEETKQRIIKNGYFILYVSQFPTPENKYILYSGSEYFNNYYDKYDKKYGKFTYFAPVFLTPTEYINSIAFDELIHILQKELAPVDIKELNN